MCARDVVFYLGEFARSGIEFRVKSFKKFFEAESQKEKESEISENGTAHGHGLE